MVTIDEQAVAIQQLNSDWYHQKVSALDILRLDLIHPVISGNKWYKLKHNLMHAIHEGYKSILTFGGAHSNHLIATAAAAKQYGIAAKGIVRGEYHKENYSATLAACEDEGMELIFINKEEYSHKHEPTWLQKLEAQFDDTFIIPEGGANEWGREGAEEIAAFIPPAYTHVCVSVGTGTTFKGLRNGLADEQQLLGFVPMKQGVYLKEEIEGHIHPAKNKNWQLFDKWHFGGFGKWNDELLAFMNDCYNTNNLPLDIVYTSKMMYGVHEMITENYFPVSARILCIHTGGLQGNASVQERLSY